MSEEKITRRSYLKYAGAGAVVVAAAAVGGYYATKAPEAPPEVIEKTIVETKTVEKKGPAVVRYITTETAASSIEFLNQFATDYAKANPGVTINNEFVDWGAITDKVIAASAAGSFPECASVDGATVNIAYQGGWLADLKDIIDEIDPAGDDFIDAALIPCKFGDQWLGIPWSANITVWWYREDWLKEEGMQPPKTWDDVLKIAEAMTKERTIDGTKVKTYGYGFQGARGSFGDQFTYMLFRANGTEMVDEDDHVIIDEEPNLSRAAETLEFQTGLAKYSPPGFLDYGWGEARGSMYGNIAGQLSSAPRVLQLAYDKKPDVYPHLKAVKVPPGPSYDGKEEYSWCALDAQVVFKDSLYPEEGKKWVKYLSTGDRVIKMLSTVPIHLLPPLRSIVKSNEYLESHPIIKENPYLLDIVIEASSRLGGEISTRYGGALKSQTLPNSYSKRLFIESFHRVWIDKMDPEDSIKILADEMRKVEPEAPIKP